MSACNGGAHLRWTELEAALDALLEETFHSPALADAAARVAANRLEKIRQSRFETVLDRFEQEGAVYGTSPPQP